MKNLLRTIFNHLNRRVHYRGYKLIIQIFLYITLTIFCLIDHFQTVALIEIGFEELNPIVLWIIDENQDYDRLLIYKIISLSILGLLLILNFYLKVKKNDKNIFKRSRLWIRLNEV